MTILLVLKLIYLTSILYYLSKPFRKIEKKEQQEILFPSQIMNILSNFLDYCIIKFGIWKESVNHFSTRLKLHWCKHVFSEIAKCSTKSLKISQLSPVSFHRICTGCFKRVKCICFACWVQTSYSNIIVDTLPAVQS